MNIIQEIKHVVMRQLELFRLGLYASKLGAARDEFARVEVTPDWCRDPLRQVRSVSSPVLDVEAPAGSTAAVVSQDGVPSAPLTIGTIYDGAFKPADQTAWLRARLNTHPGQLELGATQGVRIVVGAKASDLSPLAPGKVSIGNGTAEVVRELTETATELATAAQTLVTYFIAVTAASTALETAGGTPAGVVTFSGALKTAIATAQPNLVTVAQKMNAAVVKLNTLKE